MFAKRYAGYPEDVRKTIHRSVLVRNTILLIMRRWFIVEADSSINERSRNENTRKKYRQVKD
jgi:hypothetical protein